MTRGTPYMPGVPNVGHTSTSGFWHPGGPDHCRKPPCAPPELPRRRLHGTGRFLWLVAYRGMELRVTGAEYDRLRDLAHDNPHQARRYAAELATRQEPSDG